MVYRSLWRIEPMSSDEIISHTGLGRATVFKMLAELLREGLVKKTKYRPVGYHAPEPLKAYSMHSRRVCIRLRSGREKIDTLIRNSSGLSGELYLVKRDGGQQRLLTKGTRQVLLDEEKLRELRQAIDSQLAEAGQQRLRAWAVGR